MCPPFLARQLVTTNQVAKVLTMSPSPGRQEKGVRSPYYGYLVKILTNVHKINPLPVEEEERKRLVNHIEGNIFEILFCGLWVAHQDLAFETLVFESASKG